MPKSQLNDSNSLGVDLGGRLEKALRKADQVPRPGARDLPVIRGISTGGATDGLFENTLVEIGDVMTRSGCIFVYGNSIVLQVGTGSEASLVTLATDYVVEHTAKKGLTVRG